MPARLALAVVLLVALSGCDAFGDSVRPLAFRTLVQTDTLVVGMADPEMLFVSAHPVLLRSRADAVQFTQLYALSGPLPAIDFNTQSIVGFVGTADEPGGRITIREVALLGDDGFQFSVARVGLSRPSETPGAAAFHPLHLVATPRIEGERTRSAMYYLDPD